MKEFVLMDTTFFTSCALERFVTHTIHIYQKGSVFKSHDEHPLLVCDWPRDTPFSLAQVFSFLHSSFLCLSRWVCEWSFCFGSFLFADRIYSSPVRSAELTLSFSFIGAPTIISISSNSIYVVHTARLWAFISSLIEGFEIHSHSLCLYSYIVVVVVLSS
eukprot:gene7467-5262_t